MQTRGSRLKKGLEFQFTAAVRTTSTDEEKKTYLEAFKELYKTFLNAEAQFVNFVDEHLPYHDKEGEEDLLCLQRLTKSISNLCDCFIRQIVENKDEDSEDCIESSESLEPLDLERASCPLKYLESPSIILEKPIAKTSAGTQSTAKSSCGDGKDAKILRVVLDKLPAVPATVVKKHQVDNFKTPAEKCSINNTKRKHSWKIKFRNPSGKKKSIQKSSTKIDDKIECKICCKIINSKRYSKHLKSHANEFPKKKKSFACNICGREFPENHKLKRHSKIHSDSIKQHSCDKCDRRFHEISNLRQHMLKHSDFRPFNCGLCKASYKYAASLKTHLYYRHSSNGFKCGQCEFAFPKAITLKKHIANIHKSERSFVCEHCFKSYKTKYHLKYHQMKHVDNNRC